MKNVLSISDLNCSLDGRVVLDNVSLELGAGEILCVLGPNGSGKSSLLKSILKLFPSAGKIVLFDRELSQYSRKELARKISYSPQFLETTSSFTVLDYVKTAMYCSLFENANKTAIETLALCQSEELKDRQVATLSGGERQRILIASAIAQGSPIMLLDEPFASMDSERALDFLSILLGLRKQGRSMIVVIHDINWATYLADRILYLREGAPCFIGTPIEFIDAKVLSSVFGNRYEIVPRPGVEIPLVVPRFVDE